MEEIIKTIKLTSVFVPFKKFVRATMDSSEGGHGMAIPTDEPWQGGEAVICQLFTKDGTMGIGEMLVWLPETGVSPNQIIDAIENELYKYVLGEDPSDIDKINQKMDNNVARTEVAKGLLDMACYDLIGKISSKPVYDLIGGKQVDEIPLTALIPLTDLRTMKLMSKGFIKSGYQSIRYKLGRNVEEDIEISKTIREIAGPDINLRVDYNQAYDPKEAVRAINAIESFVIDAAEQPVNKDDYLGMAYVQERVNIPLFSHEGFFSFRDFIVLAELGAVKAAGINAERPGGISKALKVIEYAKQKSMGTIIHSQPLGIGTAALIHLATARYDSLGFIPELFGDIMLEDDLIVNSLRYDKGKVKVPEGPGWGIKLDEKALEKYAVKPSIIIEK
jgi:muconate cycloisomerase